MQPINDAANIPRPINIFNNGFLTFFIRIIEVKPTKPQIPPPNAPPITGTIEHN